MITQLRMLRSPTVPPTSKPTTPHWWTTRLKTTTKTSTSTKKAAMTQIATPVSTKSQKTILKTSWKPSVDCVTRATHEGDDLFVADGITSWILRQSQINWRQARMIARHHEDRWTKLGPNWMEPSYTNQAKKGTTNKEDLNVYLQPDRSNRDNNDLTSDITWLTTKEDSSKVTS